MMIEQMKPSGIDWIGDVPESWKTGRVKDYYSLQTGFTPDTSVAEYYDDENGYPWVSIADIDEDRLIYDTKSKISSLYIHEKHPIPSPAGSLLYSFKLSVGKVAFLASTMFTNEAIASFVNSPEVCLPYLYYSSIFIEQNANTNIYGAKILNQDLIKNAHIIFPPLTEQQRIAEHLDSQCSKLDSIIADLEKQIDTLQKYKKSLITETVTKGLDKSAPVKDSGIEWIGKIPEHWSVKRLKFMLESGSESMKVGPFGSALSGSDIIDEGKWVYNQRIVLDDNFTENTAFISEEKFKEMRGFAVNAGDILITTRGTIGKVAIVPDPCEEGILHPCIIKFRVNDSLILPELLKIIFNESDFIKDQFTLMSNATTIEVIYSYSLKDVILPVIPTEEQKGIYFYLKEKCETIDDVLKTKKSELEHIQQHKKSLICEYITGKKRVTEVK